MLADWKKVIVTLAICLTVNACAHTSTIRSTEPGAHVYVDGEHIGAAPVKFEETSGFGRAYEVAITAPGRVPLYATISQTNVNGPTLMAGLLFLPITIGIASVIVVLTAGAPPALLVAPLLGYIPAFSAFQLQDEYMFPAGAPGDEPLDESYVAVPSAEMRKMSDEDLQARMKRIEQRNDAYSKSRHRQLKAEYDRRRLSKGSIPEITEPGEKNPDSMSKAELSAEMETLKGFEDEESLVRHERLKRELRTRY